MKKTAVLTVFIMVLLTFCGCAEKSRPTLDIKKDSVTSVEFKKTCYSDSDPSFRSYVSKNVSQREDIDKIVEWAKSLKLTRHDAIEIPVDQVSYVIVLGGAKEHKLIFVGDYIVFDTAAYTFDNPSQKTQVAQNYNLLNYEESESELDLIK